MVAQVEHRLRTKAAALLQSIEGGLDRMVIAWLLIAGLASAARIAFSPSHGPTGVETIAPYLLLVIAPAASMVLALHWFRNGESLPQPSARLAIVGKWQSIGRDRAMRHSLYGAGGIMVSLLVGMLLNVPVRALEYLAAMPALTGTVPPWLAALNLLMTLDVVLVSSLYVIAFVAALRRVPLFPRLLAAIWAVDITMQLIIAEVVAAQPGLPAGVAGALHTLLEGNVKKVLISIAIWLPYLLLSKRVNVTYRHRLPA